MTSPVLAKALIEIARETVYGEDPGGGTVFPYFGPVTGPDITSDVITRRTAGEVLPSRVVPRTQQLPDFSTVLLGGATPSLADAMDVLLDIGGFVSSGEGGWTSGLSEASATIRFYLDGTKYVIPGARGGFTIEASTPGEPIRVRTALQGLYQRARLERMPLDAAMIDPNDVVKLCDAGFEIEVDGLGVIKLKFRGFQIATNPALEIMTTSNREGKVWDIRMADVDYRWSCEVEHSKDVNWTDDVFAKELPARLLMTLGVGHPSPWKWWTEDKTAFLLREPTIQVVQGGITTVNLVFGLSGRLRDRLRVGQP